MLFRSSGEGEGEGKSWYDSTSGLTWQNEPDEDQVNEQQMEWQSARDHCANLSYDGNDDWRLPSIGELRSLIRGCSPTMTGGICNAEDGCLKWSCKDDSCNGCSHNEGPAFGCYWPDNMEGPCGMYWSSSHFDINNAYTDAAWIIDFFHGFIVQSEVDDDHHVRCVRDL